MRNTVTSNDFDRGEPYDFQIQPKGLAMQILNVQRNFFWYGQFIPPVDLRPACQTWHQFMHATLCTQFNQIILIEQCRSGPHKTHVTFENAP